MDNTFYDGENTYAFDIDKILDYVNVSENKEITEKEIVDSYDIDNGKVNGKTVKQIITPMDNSQDGLRYDFIKTFIIVLLNSDYDYEDMSFGAKLAFNSLLDKGLIKIIK